VKFYIEGGYYDSLEDIARLLLLAAKGNATKAGIAFRRAAKKGVYAGPRAFPAAIKKGEKYRTSYDMLFLAARKLQLRARAKGKRWRDFTAIKKLAGPSWRTLYRKYQRRGLTLKQIALLYADYISDKTALTF
jgi:hypothetical protein